MTQLEQLRPTTKLRLYDLVREAGLDASDWANFKGGAAKAAANPKYCYEWSFVQGTVVILNLWYDSLDERGGTVSSRFNIRATLRHHAQPSGRAVWQKRARALDEAVRQAFEQHLLVRAIINAGTMRKPGDTTKSIVKRRVLDPAPWYVAKYDNATGDAVLVRGTRDPAVDQFSSPMVDAGSPADGDPTRRTVTADTFVRNSAVRDAALQRAAGRCEYCGATPFVTLDGRVFLETHHIVPLADGGPDVASNVAAVCPNHHREAHHGAAAAHIRDTLLSRAAGR